MPLIIMRHAERLDYVDKLWIKKNGRPWDPPLTEKGKHRVKLRVQSMQAGEAISAFLGKHGLPPVTRALTSPLVRCVQTCAIAAEAAGFQGKLSVEPALAEYVCDEWYYSWAIPGANANWGGPCHCRVGNVRVAKEKMHPAAREPVGSLYMTAEELNEPSSSGSCGVDLEYKPVMSASNLKRTVYDRELSIEAKSRLQIVELSEDLYPGETVLVCSHGGPVGEMYAHLINSTNPRESGVRVNQATIKVGYTALFLCVREMGIWRALVAGHDHKQRSKRLSGSNKPKVSSGRRLSSYFTAFKKSLTFTRPISFSDGTQRSAHIWCLAFSDGAQLSAQRLAMVQFYSQRCSQRFVNANENKERKQPRMNQSQSQDQVTCPLTKDQNLKNCTVLLKYRYIILYIGPTVLYST
eukprot:436886-Prorocentrum_minimum.AAC.1